MAEIRTASLTIENAGLVISEGFFGAEAADDHALADGGLELLDIVSSNVLGQVDLNMSFSLLFIVTRKSWLASARNVRVILGGSQSLSCRVSQGRHWIATLATPMIFGEARNHLLLGEVFKFTCFNLVSGFQHSHCAKYPTRTAPTLFSDFIHCSLISPIDVVWQVGSVKKLVILL